jgi:hypothetical protein
MTSGQVQRLRGVDVDAPEETEPPTASEKTDEAVEEAAETAVSEGDES